MSHDPYSPCPCGSGKKLKFCCQEILPDIIKIEKLIENQPDAAEKLLDKLLATHDDKVFLATHKASLLMGRGQALEARGFLAEFLKRQPDEPLALLALADICLTTDGFENAKRIIHRAFQLVGKQYPTGVSRLAGRIAQMMERKQEVLSVREHMALTVRTAPEDIRSQVLMQLAYFEAQRQIPYPLRGRFALCPVELEDDSLKQEEKRARLVSQIGCWDPASIIYSRLVKAKNDDPRLWHNLGLFQAWDGRSSEAIVSLRKAAELAEDYEFCVETETLAQLLQLEKSEDRFRINGIRINVGSLSEAISKLDDHPRTGIVRSRDHEEEPNLVREFELLDREAPDDFDSDDIPEILADLAAYDAAEGEEPELLLTVAESEQAAAVELLKSILGDTITQVGEAELFNSIPTIYQAFDWKLFQPTGMSNDQWRRRNSLRLQQEVDAWLQQPHPELNDIAPAAAIDAGIAAYKVDAAVFVLDAVCVRMSEPLDVDALRSQLKLPELTLLTPDADTVLTGLPLLQFHRLDTSAITDDQVLQFSNRISLVNHDRLMKNALKELVARPAALEEFGAIRAHLIRATIARNEGDFEQVVKSFQLARDAVEDGSEAFRQKLELDIRELSFRLDRPNDPELPNLLRQIRDKYFHKLPEIAEVIREELEASSCLHLLDEISAGNGGLWTPEKEATAATSETSGKLWLPGQD